jgi:hypothetical protein
MKKVFSVIVFCFLMSSLSAKIWTVDNTGKVANFTTTTAAVTSAQDGDTLLIGGSATAYADITLSKKLVIYGTGYFLTENPNTIETKALVTINSITFAFGSNGSELIGITSGTMINVTVDAANIIIRRCYISQININGNNCLLKQCYITFTSSAWCLTITGLNNIIRNCFVYNTYTGNLTYNRAISSSGSNVFENNIIYGNVTLNSCAFGNNIYRFGTASFTNCDPYNNICNDIQCGTTNGNQAYVNITNVFITSGTSDSKWQLSGTSVAKAAGLGGVDCGIYGGNDPYILSGMPDIPVITSIVVPGRANLTNGLNVQINIRSNK